MDRPAKDWQDRPSVATPLDAAGLEDLEDRVFGYAESQVATRDMPVPGAPEDGFVPVYDHGTLAYVWTGVATSTTVDDAVAAHSADTTSVHGIANTANLLTSSSTAGGDVSGTLSNLQLGSGVVTATEVNSTLKPSGSAATTDESLRRLGTGSTHAAAGDDSRFPSSGEKNALAGTNGTPGSGNKYVTDSDSRNTDTRTPTDGSVTNAKVNASAAIVSSKLADGAFIPSTGQKDALAGTSGTPSSSNPYATKATTDGLQPLDTDLTAIAALTSTADKVPYATGSGTWSLADFTSAGRALVDDADAAAQRATLSVYSIAGADSQFATNVAFLGDVAALNNLAGAYAPIYVSPMAVRVAGGTQLTRAVMNETITSSFNGWTASPAAVGLASVPVIGSGMFSVSGRTTKLKTVLTIFTNATAPTISFTAGISALSSAGGADALSISWSTEVSGSTCTVTTPAASSIVTAVSSAYDAPADGAYAPVFSMSGAMPATNPRVGVVMSIWRAYA